MYIGMYIGVVELDEKDEPGNDEAGTVFSWIINIRVLCGCGVGARFSSSLSAIPHKIIININQVPSLVLCCYCIMVRSRARSAPSKIFTVRLLTLTAAVSAAQARQGRFYFLLLYIYSQTSRPAEEEGRKQKCL